MFVAIRPASVAAHLRAWSGPWSGKGLEIVAHAGAAAHERNVAEVHPGKRTSLRESLRPIGSFDPTVYVANWRSVAEQNQTCLRRLSPCDASNCAVSHTPMNLAPQHERNHVRKQIPRRPS